MTVNKRFFKDGPMFSFMNTMRVSNSLNPDQARHFVGLALRLYYIAFCQA